ncbi:3H domain-containing protein [Methanobacterium alcaliphilum]|uniref:3H domain-containing protein n=1 Tax=Methanobacterium alcaliphilum TaxID=392018 RepID=UPI00200A6249|nr:3H domain-containing protein [Methanobacterium alcaliphilum]MCK9151430.1 NAD-binding protein [Methanobacterium alcaliphilum]
MASSRIPQLPTAEDIQAVPLSVFYYALLALGGLIIYGFVGSIYIMNLNPVDALYFAIVTLATVGYGDILPATAIQKIFAVSLALGGVGLIAYVFSLSVSVITMTFEEITSGSKMRKKMAAMENHFVLCGYGRVGAAVFKELKERNQKTIIIEKDRNLVEKELWEDPKVLAIPGDATEESVMKEAGIERARGVIITTGDDVDNLFITLTSREIHPNIWIVTRASKKENIKRLYRSGADRVISPETSGGEDIYFAAIEPTMLKITVMHDVEDIRKEAEIILKYGCTLEDIEYHLPEFKEPLVRKIGVTKLDQLNTFLSSLEKDVNRKKSLERIYESVSGIHSHWISGPDKETLNKLADELKKEDLLLGVNLEADEIKNVARKYGRLVEVVIKPEITIVENHGVSEIGEEAEIILNQGCALEDIEYYLPGFREPLKRNIGIDNLTEIKKFLNILNKDSTKKDSLDRIYALSGGGIHTHRISGPNTMSLGIVEKKLRDRGFLLGVNMTQSEIRETIQKSGKVVQMLVKHEVGKLDDKNIIIGNGGRILDSKHYLPGVRQVVSRNLNLRNKSDLERCQKEYERPDARRSLTALYEISRHIHLHTIAAPDVKKIKKIEKQLDKQGILLGVNLSEDDIWKIVEQENVKQFCIE